jgi:signal peptide peptidase SppA
MVMSHTLPHLAARLYGVPLLIHRPKLDVILSVLESRGPFPSAAMAEWAPPARTRVAEPTGIAIIEIHGSLVRRTGGLDPASGLLSYEAIATQLDAALADPQVQGILLSVDSAGGEAGGVFDLADKLFAARAIKPIWAVAEDLALSAAYALASAAHRVWVTRTGGVGSIGAIALHVDQSARDAMDGLVFTPIYAGARKNDLSPHQALGDRARVALQAEVDRLYELFVATVGRHRRLEPEAIRTTEAGLFYADDALRCGLADAVGSRHEALTAFVTVLAAPTSTVPQPFLATLPPEITMSDDAAVLHPCPQTLQSGPTPVTLTTQEAVEIAQLCTLAGCPERIVGLLESGATSDQVRRSLLDAKAAASPEISSWIGAQGQGTGTQTALDSAQPLMAAVRRLVERQPLLRKE